MSDDGRPSETEKTKAHKEKTNPVTNNFLAAAVFTAFLAAVALYLKTANNLPDKLRYPAQLTCVVVLVVILVQFAFNTVRLMQAKHKNDMTATQIEAARLEHELKKVQTANSEGQVQLVNHNTSKAVIRNALQRPKQPVHVKHDSEIAVQKLGLPGDHDDAQ